MMRAANMQPGNWNLGCGGDILGCAAIFFATLYQSHLCDDPRLPKEMEATKQTKHK